MHQRGRAIGIWMAFILMLTACGGGQGASSTGDAGSSGGSEETSAQSEVSSEAAGDVSSTVNMTDENTMVVGAPSFTGMMMAGIGGSANDEDFWYLLGTHSRNDLSYATIYTNEAAEFLDNPTVNAETPKRVENADGSVTYTFVINSNLVWNDGQPITAKDYVLTALYISGPEWAALGAMNGNWWSMLLGYDAYHTGADKIFAGLRVLSDNSFSVTMDPAYVPYFYERKIVSLFPSPMHRFVPNLDIEDSENGVRFVTKAGYEVTEEDKRNLLDGQKNRVESAKQGFETQKAAVDEDGKPYYDGKAFDALAPKLDALSEEERTQALTDGKLADGTEIGNLGSLYTSYRAWKDEEDLLAQYESGVDAMDPTELLLKENLLDVSQNYCFKPDVTCGPYSFVSNENKMLKVTLNDKFVGNAEGKKPTIPNIIMQEINQDLRVDLLQAGTIDLNTAETTAEKINRAKEIHDADGSIDFVYYNRSGYGQISIVCDQGATKYQGVRQAIAYSIDRESFVQSICGGYGTVVQGAYGLDMWEWQEKGEELEGKLINYTQNPDKANEALDTTPYKYEKDGTTPFDPQKAADAYNNDKENFDYYRYDADGNELIVYHEGSQGIEVSDLINAELPDAAKLCGMKYLVNITEFSTLLTHYYTPDPSDLQAPTAFNLATNFEAGTDPYEDWHSSQIGSANVSRISDPEMDAILEKLHRTDPSKPEEWTDLWAQYQLRWNELLPEIPLYSNLYYDMFTKRVKGLETSAYWNWACDICDIYLEN